MIALLAGAAGAVSLTAGLALLARSGPGYRVGRLLAVAPDASLEEVAAIARSGRERYVRTHGRITSDEEFPDENDRPLVYRRRRLQRPGRQGRWDDLDDERLAVPFGIEDRRSFVAIDVDALGEGLVVVPRLAEGTAGELPEAFAARLPGLPASAPVRLRIEQLSAVEHATAAGVPRLGVDGQPILTSGLGRPLIVSPLELDAAMRVLAGDRRRLVLLAGALLVGGLGALAVGVVAWVAGA
jgi:hypothetical protein